MNIVFKILIFWAVFTLIAYVWANVTCKKTNYSWSWFKDNHPAGILFSLLFQGGLTIWVIYLIVIIGTWWFNSPLISLIY